LEGLSLERKPCERQEDGRPLFRPPKRPLTQGMAMVASTGRGKGAFSLAPSLEEACCTPACAWGLETARVCEAGSHWARVVGSHLVCAVGSHWAPVLASR